VIQIFQIAATIGLLTAVPSLLRAWAAVKSTTLRVAWGWLVAGFFLWAVCWGVTILVPITKPALADQLWYATAIVFLCSGVAVLGARKPGTSVWSWFVVLPLLLVLGWPALMMWGRDFQVSPLQLERPAVLCYALVLVMGYGNYFGTRSTTASLLAATALILLIANSSDLFGSAFPETKTCRIGATFCISAAIAIASRQMRRRLLVENALEGLWIDFRDSFGIVWARRIQDRMNQTAQSEKWPVRLQMHGFVTLSGDMCENLEPANRIEHAFRWQLRRFVDPAWIDQRLDSHCKR